MYTPAVIRSLSSSAATFLLVLVVGFSLAWSTSERFSGASEDPFRHFGWAGFAGIAAGGLLLAALTFTVAQRSRSTWWVVAVVVASIPSGWILGVSVVDPSSPPLQQVLLR